MTLVELLVSVSLTVFMLTLFAILFQSGNNAVTNARGVAEIDRQVRGAITRIHRDIEHVYLGEGVSLGHMFERYGEAKDGYFTIEENVPASPPYMLEQSFDPTQIADPELQATVTIFKNALLAAGSPSGAIYRQGVDARGLPVEMDVDDVLAFTVRLSGTSKENVFVGRVPRGSVLDNGFSPESRFDQPNNGLFTSPLAEVVYFLRPERPYRLTEINNPSLQNRENRLLQVPRYTLYRRELLLLTEGQRQSLEFPKDAAGLPTLTGGFYPLDDMAAAAATGLNPGLISGNPDFNPSFYQHYDVSAYFGYNQKKQFPIPNTLLDLYDLSKYTLRWNSPVTIRQRRNRYGMRWLGALAPPNYSPAGPQADYAPIDPDGATPDYDHYTPAGSASRQGFRTYLPVQDPNNPTQPFAWHGRPTLFESTLVGSEGAVSDNYNPSVNSNVYASLSTTVPSLFAPSGHVMGDAPSNRRRSGGDVLLQNVLSFDVKVLNDDVVPGTLTNGTLVTAMQQLPGGMGSPLDIDVSTLQPARPVDDLNWPAFRTMTLAPRDPYLQLLGAGNLRAGLIGGNPTRRPGYAPNVPIPPSTIQPDFVDLGMMLVPEVPAKNSGPLATFNANNDVRFNIARARYYLPFGFIDLSTLPNTSLPPFPLSVSWGQQTPARWMSTGRRESSSCVYDPSGNPSTNFFPLRSTYDTWAPEYYPEYYTVQGDVRANAAAGTTIPPAYTPPYDRPLRGIQITIRVLEPKSGIEREFRIVHRFE